MRDRLMFAAEVRDALESGAPVVALETTVLAHGMPWPHNLDTVLGMVAAVRAGGAVPAVIGLTGGRIVVGMDERDLRRFAVAGTEDGDVEKASRRDLAYLLARGLDGATTVAGTMVCARLAGIRVFATGGIGGVHRGGEETLDISADLSELARTPVAVVCAGAKSILDLPRTLEVLETGGVPVLGYRTDSFPAFHTPDSGLPVMARVDTPAEAAEVIRLHLANGDCGLLLACPIPPQVAIDRDTLEGWIGAALAEAEADGISGKAVTPYLLERLSVLSGEQTRIANQALLVNNARIAAEVAVALDA